MNACTPMEVRELEKLIASLAYKCGTDVSRIFDDFLISLVSTKNFLVTSRLKIK